MFKSFINKLTGLDKKLDNNKFELNGKFEFQNAMSFVNNILESDTDRSIQLEILNYILNIIKEDLKTDLLTTVFYQGQHFEKSIRFPFPSLYYDEHGNELLLELSEETKTINLEKDSVMVLAWNKDRMGSSLKTLSRRDFEFDKLNHFAYYYSGVDICYINNGKHSISAGLIYKKGFIEANIYNIQPLFLHVDTDGENWFSKHDRRKLGNLFDFRIGVIYEVSRLIHNRKFV